MKIVISPAKSLDLKSEIPTNDFTIPVFIDKTEILNAKIAIKSKKAIKELMNISDNLAELNQLIADQKGVTIADLALAGEGGSKKELQVAPSAPAANAYLDEGVASTEEVITDEILAAKYRSDADRLSKEAAALRRQAEELVPTKKKTSKTTASA